MQTKIGWLGVFMVGLAAGIFMSNGSARAAVAATPTHHRHHHIHGKITAVSSTSITIAIHKHHKKGAAGNAAGASETKTFEISNATKVIRVSPNGKAPGSLSDLKVGEHVAIAEKKGMVHGIAIMSGHHKKKKQVA